MADGQPVYHGDTSISGVPGAGAPIRLDFEDTAGGSTGALLPTGNVIDVIAGVSCTLIDNGMPVVVMRAEDVGVSGYETCAELEANGGLRANLEEIRREAGHLMHLGDVSDTTVPKLTMISAPRDGGTVNTRTFIPHRCHDAIGVLGAVSVATAIKLPGSAGASVGHAIDDARVVLEHPTGTFETSVAIEDDGDGFTVTRSGIVRTARKLMDGTVYPR